MQARNYVPPAHESHLANDWLLWIACCCSCVWIIQWIARPQGPLFQNYYIRWHHNFILSRPCDRAVAKKRYLFPHSNRIVSVFFIQIILIPTNLSFNRCTEYHLIKAVISCLPPGLIKQTLSCVMATSILSAPNHTNGLPWDLILGSVYWGRFPLWQQRAFHHRSSDIKQAAHCSRLTSGRVSRCSIWLIDEARSLTGQGQNSPNDS